MERVNVLVNMSEIASKKKTEQMQRTQQLNHIVPSGHASVARIWPPPPPSPLFPASDYPDWLPRRMKLLWKAWFMDLSGVEVGGVLGESHVEGGVGVCLAGS